VQYVEAMKALVIYVYAGKIFLFDAAGYGEELGGPTKLERFPPRTGPVSRKGRNHNRS